MKKSTLLLVLLSAGLLISMTAANLNLKQVYDRLDKSNPFWNYNIVVTGKFSHLHIEDNKSTWISFRPGPNGSAGVLTDLSDQHRVKSVIRNDTLFIKIIPRADDPDMRNWLSRSSLVCVTSPALKSISGNSAGVLVKDLSVGNFGIDLAGKSEVEIETLRPDFDSLFIFLRDSSSLKFEMAQHIPSTGTLTARYLKTALKGHSFFDAGRLMVETIDNTISDSAAITLSGATLEKLRP